MTGVWAPPGLPARSLLRGFGGGTRCARSSAAFSFASRSGSTQLRRLARFAELCGASRRAAHLSSTASPFSFACAGRFRHFGGVACRRFGGGCACSCRFRSTGTIVLTAVLPAASGLTLPPQGWRLPRRLLAFSSSLIGWSPASRSSPRNGFSPAAY